MCPQVPALSEGSGDSHPCLFCIPDLAWDDSCLCFCPPAATFPPCTAVLRRSQSLDLGPSPAPCVYIFIQPTD
jgi:hypothetical protein